MWADGAYVRAGLEKEKSVAEVVPGVLSDGSKVVLSATLGYRGRGRSWSEVLSEVLRDLRDRGLRSPRLASGDDHPGIWEVIRNACPEAAEQRCYRHNTLNALARVPKRQRAQVNLMLRAISYAETPAEAERLWRVVARWCAGRSYQAAALEHDWYRMVALCDLPKEHWRHLWTTSPMESPFSMLWIRTKAATRYKRVDRATAMIWTATMVAESQLRRMHAPQLQRAVYQAARYADGIPIEAEAARVAVRSRLHTNLRNLSSVC